MLAAIALLFAGVSVSSGQTCLDATGATLALEQTLAAASGDRVARLDVAVAATSGAVGMTAISLSASTAEGVVLSRQFSLVDADCAQAPELLDAVLSRFLDGFPREKWTVEAPASRSKPQRKPWGIAPRVTADLGLLPSQEDPLIADTSGDFEMAIAPDRGGVTGEILLRLGTWSDVGGGRYQPVTVLAGTGWAWVRPGRSAQIGVRSGVLGIRGDRNAEPISEKLLPWVEAHAGIAWKAGPVRIGPQIALSLIRVNAETEGGEDRRVVPTNRVGFRLEVPL